MTTSKYALTGTGSAVLLFVAAFPYQFNRPASTKDVAEAMGWSVPITRSFLGLMLDAGYVRQAPGAYSDQLVNPRWQLPLSLRGVA